MNAMRDLADVPDAFDERGADPHRALGLVRLEDVRVMVGAAGVEMDAVESR
jgi:hypothetical protein